MRDARDGGTRDELVMNSLVEGLLVNGLGISCDTCPVERCMERHVDLVEGQPQADPTAKALEDNLSKAGKELDEPAVRPAAVLCCEVHRHLIVGERDKRLDAVGEEVVDEPVIEGQTLLVRLFLVSPGEDARPGDRNAQDLEPGLGEELDVSGIAVIEVDRDALEVVVLWRNAHSSEHAVGKAVCR